MNAEEINKALEKLENSLLGYITCIKKLCAYQLALHVIAQSKGEWHKSGGR